MNVFSFCNVVWFLPCFLRFLLYFYLLTLYLFRRVWPQNLGSAFENIVSRQGKGGRPSSVYCKSSESSLPSQIIWVIFSITIGIFDLVLWWWFNHFTNWLKIWRSNRFLFCFSWVFEQCGGNSWRKWSPSGSVDAGRWGHDYHDDDGDRDDHHNFIIMM